MTTGVCVDLRNVAGAVIELLAAEAATDKLGTRGITTEEARQIPRNSHLVARNPHQETLGKLLHS